MSIAEIAILSAATGFVLVEMLQIAVQFDIKRKPFTCANCMSGWTALIICLLTAYYWQAPFIMCLAMLVSAFINPIMKRL